jgi:hypothetical protein
MEMLREDAYRIFKKHRAPLEWGEEEVRFLLLIAGRPKQLCWHGEPEIPTCSSIEIAAVCSRPSTDEEAALCGILFSHLFAASPDAVLKIMLDLRRLIKTRCSSPVFKVATWLFGQDVVLEKEWIGTDKAEIIADRAGLALGCKVSPKVVEHARSRLRRVKAWAFPRSG